MVATRSSKAPARPRLDVLSHPSEEELIGRYLLPRVSENKPSHFIHDADVYSLGPAELTIDFAPATASNGDRAWYFFSPVRAKSREGQRKARTVDRGDGCWHSEAGARPVVEEPCRRLGHRQSFSFVTKVDGRRVRSGWLMVELCLDGTDDMVLCKIYLSPRAHLLTGTHASSRKRKAAAVDEDDDDEKNPAPVRQRRIARPTEIATPPHVVEDDDDDDTAGVEAEQTDDTQTLGGGIVDEKSVAEDDAAGDSFLSQIERFREEFFAQGFVDRPDEEIRADYGLEEMYQYLDGAAKKREEMLQQLWSSYDDTAGNSCYPVCLSLEDLYSTEPLWFERPRRGYHRR